MAKKADLLAQAQDLGLEVTEKNTIAELEAAIGNADTEQNAEQGEPEVTAVAEEAAEETFAKSGKRSKKAVEEAQAEVEKEERKEAAEDEEVKKNPAPKTRPLIERRGKKYRNASKSIAKDTVYSLNDAIKAAVETSTVNFDASIELHVRLNVDPKHADQNIRDSLVLPEGTGKEIRVAVFAEDDDVKTATAAGADVAGNDEFLEQLEKGVINFDVLIAAPTMMVKLSKYARVLGPKGLMPNPKSGTVTKDIEKAVKEAKGGKVEYRVDETGIVHVPIGKVSFGAERLVKNADAFVASLQSNKPSSVKGSYVVSAFATSSMGPSIKFEL